MQPILPSQPSHFFLHPAAVTFAFNALGDPDNIGISVYSNAQVLLFVRDIDGLDQLPDNNYRSWTLSAYPTHFTDADGCARYCHIAFSRTTNQATLVFPDTRLDLLGRAITDDGQSFLSHDGTPIATVPEDSSEVFAPNPDHYFAFIGKITASGPASSKQPRQWANIAAYPITGNLDTATYREYEQKGDLDKMFRYSSQYGNDGAILQLLPITVSRIWRLLIGTAEKAITDLFRLSDRAAEDLPSISRGSTEDTAPTITAPLDEVIPTEAHMRDYTDQNFLSKKKGGTVEADVTFRKDVAVLGDVTTGGDHTVGGDLTTHGNAAFGSNVGSQSFATGLMGNGWRFDEQGHGEADSLSLRKFLEVPELRYNKISVRTGVQWQTFGAGLIEEVMHPEGLADNEGVIKLKLEDGEYGAVAADDLCMGIYHNEGDGKGNNATHTADDHNGNFAFQGFTTIYFRIVGICDANGSLSQPDSRNQYFRYELRPDWKTGGFDQTSTHPQPSMTFACYANPSNAERQSSVYSSTDYLIMLSGMVDWTYDSSNITYIRGRLAGFTINTTKGDMALEGYGIAIGKEYRWGTEIVFDRPAQLINQQLYLAISDKQPDEFKASISSVVWTDEAISPTKEKPYKYGYWKKTYILDGDEVISPKNNQPTAADVSLQGTYAESGESAISILYEPSNIVIVDVSTSAWNEEGEGVTAEVAADSYHRVTVKMMYGQQVESISNIVIGTAKGIVDAQVEIAADNKSAVIAFGVTKDLPINQTTYLPLTFHSIHTTVGYRNDLVVTTSVAGNDGQDGQQGVGIASYNEQYYANDGSPIPDSTVGFISPTMAGFSAEHPCLWNKTTIINTLNEVVNNPRWDVISWWGRDGKDTYRQYSVDGVNDWHNTYTDGDIYERVSTDGVEWSKPFRIVGENGAAGPYTDYSFALSTWADTDSATQCPPDVVKEAQWKDAPIKPTPERPYLWQRSIRYSLAGNTLVPGAPCYVRINGKDGVIGQHGISTFTTYNGQKTEPERPTGNGEGNGWHRNPDDCGTPIWASQKQAVNVEDGEWSAPYKCSATDGQSVNIKDTLPNAAAIFAISNPEVNDAYIAEDTGVVYVWNGVNWVNCGKFRGEDGRDGVDGYDGVSSYLHLKYSDDGLSFTAPDGTYAKGERPSAWMGTLVDTNEEDPVADADFNRYKWVHIQGMPATTYEIITSAYVIAKDTNGNAKEGITMDFYKVTGEQREKADCYVAVSKDGVETIARYNKTPLVLTATELSSINALNVEMRITADGEAVDHISLSTIKDGENGNSIHIKGHKATAAELASVDNPQINDAWVVDENGCLYVYTATGWDNVGKFSGKDGEDGKDGQNVVVYAIVPSCSILSMSTDGEAADGIKFAFYKYEGSLTRVPQPMYYNIKVKYTDGHIYEETKETADPSVTIPSQKLDNCEWVLCEVWVNKADKGESTKRDAYETIYTVTDGTIPSWNELTDDQKNDLRGEDGASSEFIYLLSDTYPFNEAWAPKNPDDADVDNPTDRYADEFVPSNKYDDGDNTIQWTDDPQPVSPTMRYQYIAVRYKNVKKNNDRKRYWSDWSAVSLWNRYAEDGKDGVSPLVIDLANEMTSIPVDEQGQVTKEITLTLQLDAYIGTTQQTITAVTCTPPTGVSFSTASGLATPTITFSQGYTPAEVTDFVIEASVGTEKRTVTFTVAAIKSGGQGEDAELYELAPSDSAVSFSRDENNNLLPVKGVQIQMQVKKTKGSSSSIFDIDNKSALPPFNIRYAFDDLRPTYNTGTVWPTALSHTLTITTEQALAHRSLNVAMFDSSNKLIDRETLPIVRDGNKGEDGEDGEDGKDAIITDLTNETDTIGVGSDGVLDVTTTVTTTVVVYSGQTKTEQTAAPELSGPLADVCEITTTKNGTDYDISIKLPVGLTFEEVEVYRKTLTITPVVDGMNPSSKVFSLVGNLDAEDGEIIYLVPSVSAIKKTADGYSVRRVWCDIYKKVGSSEPEIITNQTESGYRIYFMLDGGNEIADDGTNKEIVGGKEIYGIPPSAFKNEIKFILRHGETIIDTETVPLVADGEDGEDGTDGADGIDGIDGENSVSVVVNKGNIVLFDNDTQIADVSIEVYEGQNRVSNFSYHVPTGNERYQINNSVYWINTPTIGTEYRLVKIKEFSGTHKIPFAVTYNGVQYDAFMQVAYKKDGKDGNDAVLYSLDHISSFLMRKVSGQYVFVEDIYHFTFFKTVGNQPRETLNGNYRVRFEFLNANRASLAAPYTAAIPSTGKVEFDVSSDWFDEPQYDPSIDYYRLLADSMQYLVLSLLDSNGNVLATSDMNRVNEGEQGPQGPRGDRGPSGINGCVVVPCGEWKDDFTYVNDENTTKDQREIHVVLCDGQPYKRLPLAYPVVKDGGIDKIVYVKPGDNTRFFIEGSDGYYTMTSEPAQPDGTMNMDWQNWWTTTSWDPFVAARLLLADNAYIQFASGQASYYMDEQRHIRVGISAETRNKNNEKLPMIFAGADIRNLDATDNPVPATEAPFRVYDDGTLIAANVNSKFQDVSGYTSVDEDGGSNMELSIETIRKGGLMEKSGVQKRAQPRVYNLRCDNTSVLLPTSAEYIGQRVLIYNGISTPSRIHIQDGSTFVTQDEGKTFLGVGTAVAYAQQGPNNKPIYKLDEYTEISEIAFMAGVMEFIAVPDGDGCRWAVINDGVTAKWFDGNFIM